MARIITFISLFIVFPFLLMSQAPGKYYSTIQGLKGKDLKQALHDIIDDHQEHSYSDLWDILVESDEDPNDTDRFILIYTGRSLSKTASYPDWNREHVWAKSHGHFDNDPPAGTDAHHIRPCDVTVNSDRGNLDFDNGGTQHSEATGCYYDSDSWEPRDAVKGDVARMMFYMAVRYEGDVNGEPDLELKEEIPTSGPYFGKLSTLLAWHKQDTVDATERKRNEVIFSYQKNRNPFIDHPEYAKMIWGDSQVNYPPQTLEIWHYPEQPSDTDKVNVTANIADDNSVVSAKLNWLIGDEKKNQAMTLKNGYYQSTIPAAKSTDTVLYWIVSQDNENSYGYSDTTFYIPSASGALSTPNSYQANNHQVTLFPNPAKERFYLLHPHGFTEAIHISLFNLDGKIILDRTIHSSQTNKIKIDIQGIPRGTYLLKVASNGKELNKKLLVW